MDQIADLHAIYAGPWNSLVQIILLGISVGGHLNFWKLAVIIAKSDSAVLILS